MVFFLTLIYWLCQLLSIAIFARAVLSWLPMGHNNPITSFLFNITEPILMPVRRIIPRLGLLDISPMIAMLVLQLIARVIQRF